MRKRLILVIFACMVISLLFIGCTQKKGFIMRDDITHKDLEFVYNGMQGNKDVTIDDMYCVMGLPNASVLSDETAMNIKKYSYYFDDEIFKLGVITFIFDENDRILDVEIRPFIEEPLEPFDFGPIVIDRDKYKMLMHYDITEKELEVIDMEFTSIDVQRVIGAPHDRIARKKVGLRTDAYSYPLPNGNTFIISYERNGVIVKAWVVDENKETQKIYVDRTDEFGVLWEDYPGVEDLEYK